MKNSEIFIKNEADDYFKRNIENRRFLADYILDIFSKETLSSMKVAEFGIGAGYNCFILSNYTKCIHGFEGSTASIDHFEKAYSALPNKKKFKVFKCNLATDFSKNIGERYDMIIFGHFAYVLSDKELKTTIKNAKKLLNKNGIVINFDFISRENIEKEDQRDKSLKIYKRPLPQWIKLMKGFELIDFRLLNEANSNKYLARDMGKIELDIDLKSDYNWLGVSVFKLI